MYSTFVFRPELRRTSNLNSARTFFYQGEAECDANAKVFIQCIDAVKGKFLSCMY